MRIKRLLLVGIYDTSSVSLAPFTLKIFLKQFFKPSMFQILSEEFSIFDDSNFIASQINNLEPDIIGFSVYVWNFDKVLEISKLIKGTIILGGPHVRGLEAELIKKSEIDVIVTGEGEITLKELLEHFLGFKRLAKIKGITTKEIQTSPRDPLKLDSYPSDSIYEDIFQEHPDLTWICIETLRGCLFNCKYCIWGDKSVALRYFSLDRIKKDLEIIHQQKTIRYLYFCDSNLLFDKTRAKEIFQYLIDLKFDKAVKFEFDYLYLDEEILKLLNRLPKCEFVLGLQTAMLNTSEIMGKRFQKSVFEKQIERIQRFAKNCHVGVDVIYGLPGDNLASYLGTLDYVISFDGIEKILPNNLILLPGTNFFNHRDEYGFKFDKKSYIVKETNTFSKNEMELARRYSFYVFLIYLNHSLKRCIKYYTFERLRHRYIDTIIGFMNSLSQDILDETPFLLAGNWKDSREKEKAITQVIKRYDDIIEAFKDFSNHRYDDRLTDYRESFSMYFKRYKQIYLEDKIKKDET